MIYSLGGGLVIFIWVWAHIANEITSLKRGHLVNHWVYSGNVGLAYDEFNLVDFKDHYWRVFFFRSARVLYGPLLQGVWNHSSNNVNTYDEWWWRCYNEIYLKLTKGGNTIKNTRAYLARGNSLPVALTFSGISVEEWLLAEDKVIPPPKFSMTDGVEEYEAIMQTQELMEGS